MQKRVNKFLFLCLTFVFLIGIASAWSVDITKLNNNAPTTYYSAKVTKFSYQINGINCDNITRVWYTLDEGLTNYTASCGVGEMTLSGLSSNEYNNTWAIYASDDSATTNLDSVAFWIDSISPILNYIIPSGNLAYTNLDTLSFQFYLDELNKGFYWGLPDKYFYFKVFNKYDSINHFYNNALGIDANNNSEQDNLNLIGANKYEGNYTWTTFAKDKYPNGSTIREVTQTGTIIRDVTAPTITDDYVSDGIWVNLDQLVTLTPLDLLSYIGDVKYCEGIACDPSIGTILGIPYQLNYNADQDTIVRYQVWDLATNPSAVGEYNIKLDKTLPVTTDNALSGWQNANQTITLFPTDPLTNGVASGILDTFYQINGAGFTNYLTPVLVSQEGINTFDYYSTDNAGNIETTNSISIMIDKSLPISLIISPVTSSWQNSDFNVARTDSDAYSDLNFCETRILDNTFESLPWTITPCNTDYLIDTTAECTTEGADTCEIQIRSTDNVNWISNIDSRTFSIDTIAPVVDAGLDVLTNSIISQDATTSDATSGIASWSWTQQSGPGTIAFGTPNTEDTTISADTDGIYTIRLTVTDNAGNSAFNEINFEWDTTAPVLDITSPLTGTNVNGDEIITFTDNELTSPECSVDGSNYILCTSGITILTDIPEFAGLSEGIFTLYLRDTDLAGNPGTDFESGIIKDTISPNVIISSLESDPTNANPISAIATFDEDITGFDIPDLVIGNGNAGSFVSLDAKIYTFDITPTADGLVTIDIAGNVAQDLAGNLNNPTLQFSIEYDGTLPSITLFQATPSQNISQNNPTIIDAVDVSDLNLDFTGLMFVDSNNLISSDQILFLANMDDAPVSGPYGPINWDANYFKITDGTISEPISVFVTDLSSTEYIVMGYLENPSAPVEDCMLEFDDATYDLISTTCLGIIDPGITKFTIKSLKFTNGILNPPTEVNGNTFTLYDFSDPANPVLELNSAPTGNYNLILQVEDSAENENGATLTISVDNTYPSLTNIALSSSTISPINADGYLDDLTIDLTASELVDWGTVYIYNSTGDAVFRDQSLTDWVLVNSIIWNGSYNYGYGLGSVPDGIYNLTLTTTSNKALNDSASNINSSIFVGSVIVDNTIPTLSGISATSITSSSESIIWTTDENANSNVSYGTTILTTSNSVSTTYESSHSISLSSLSASTFYYFNVSSCDTSGNCATSTQYNFTTSAQDNGGNDNGGNGNGGGGGGGGSSSIKYYECSEWAGWSECSNNLQTRVCLKKALTTSQKGVIESKFNSTETKECTASALIPLSNTNTETEENNLGNEEAEKTSTFVGRITGGITGAAVGLTKSKSGKISLIVIGVLALAFGSLVLIRKRIRNKQARRIRIIHKSDLGKK